jgi:phosphatidylglycerophosphatase A
MPLGAGMLGNVPSRAVLLRDPGHLLAFGFGSGFAPVAPGTWGSLVGIGPAWWLLALPLTAQLGILAFLFCIGVLVCDRAARALGIADPKIVVFDEIVAVMMTLTFCSSTIIGFFTGFCAFRFFDIVKPWPISLIDRHVKGGFGIMLDDVAAAIFAVALIKIIEYFS